MSTSWREGWEVGHTLQESAQTLQTGAGGEARDALLGLGCTADPGAGFAWSRHSKRCRVCCQPPPCSNLFPDYVTLHKRELFRPSFQLKQYCN